MPPPQDQDHLGSNCSFKYFSTLTFATVLNLLCWWTSQCFFLTKEHCVPGTITCFVLLTCVRLLWGRKTITPSYRWGKRISEFGICSITRGQSHGWLGFSVLSKVLHGLPCEVHRKMWMRVQVQSGNLTLVILQHLLVLSRMCPGRPISS